MLKRILPQTFSAYSKLRCISTSSVVRLKEICVEARDEKTTIVRAQFIKSPREPYLLKLDQNSDKCPLCQLQLNLKHTDVLILSQFIDEEGHVLRRSVTGLCRNQYKIVRELVFMAQYAGLLPEPPREEPKKPYQLLNTYYNDMVMLKTKKRQYGNKLYYLKLGPIEKLRVKPNKLV